MRDNLVVLGFDVGAKKTGVAIGQSLTGNARALAHASETNYGGRSTWAVWIGPFPSKVEALKVQQQLGSQKIPTIIKPASSYL